MLPGVCTYSEQGWISGEVEMMPEGIGWYTLTCDRCTLLIARCVNTVYSSAT